MNSGCNLIMLSKNPYGPNCSQISHGANTAATAEGHLNFIYVQTI